MLKRALLVQIGLLLRSNLHCFVLNAVFNQTAAMTAQSGPAGKLNSGRAMKNNEESKQLKIDHSEKCCVFNDESMNNLMLKLKKH